MKSYNKIIILGNVTADPDVKEIDTKAGKVSVARFSVATSTGGYKKQDGTEVPEETQFHRVTAWRGLAEVAKNYIHKGDTVFVTGEVKYTEVDKDGKKDHYTDIIADEVSLCRSKNGAQATEQPAQQMQQGWGAPQPQYGGYPQPGYPQGYPQQGYPQQGYPQYPPQQGTY